MADKKILLVGDENKEAIDIKRTLESFGYEVPYIAFSGEEALEKALKITPDLILIDIVFKEDNNNIKLVSEIKNLNIPVIYLTTHSEESIIQKAKLTRPYGCIIKPYGAKELEYAIELALYKNQMEKELKESEKSYRKLVNNSMVAIYKTNLKGDILFANQAMVELFDFKSVEELKTKKSPQLYKNPEDRTKIIEKLKREGKFSHYEIDTISNTGRRITILLSANFENKTISGMIMDITQFKKVRNELLESEKFLENIIENIPNMIFIKNADNLKFKMVNKAGEELLGHSREKLIGKSDYDYFPKDEADFFTKKDREVLQNQKLLDIPEETIETKKLGQRILHTKKIPIFNKEGNPQYLLGISEDITELKNTEKKLTRAYDDLESKVQERTAEILKSKEELRLSNLYNRGLLEASIDPLVTIGSEGKIMDVNGAVELVTGYSRDQVIGTDFSDYCTDPEKARAGYREVFSQGIVKDYPLEIQHKDGHVTPVLYNATVYHDENNKVMGVFAAARDITQLIKAEEELKEHNDNLEITVKKRTVDLTNVNVLLKAEIKERKRMELIIQDNVKRLNLALESAAMGAWDLDLVNDTSIRTLEHDQIFGYDYLLPKWGAKILFEHILPEDREHVMQRFEKSKETNKLYFQCRIMRVDDKKMRWIEAYANVYHDDKDVPIRMLGVVSDITERKDAETQLLKVIEEKEMLLREIHHRVKNNMQIISSLLHLESSHVFDKRDVDLFMTVQDRVKSMSLIHGNLYESDDLSSIKFKDYIESLTSQLSATHAANSNVKLVLDIMDISLNMETAIPLGLIINELVTNSLKYAFPDSKGEITIFIHSKGEEIQVIIKDNGTGLPKDFDIKKPKNLGLQLVNSLVEQLEGTIKLNKSQGAEFIIKIKELKYTKRFQN